MPLWNMADVEDALRGTCQMWKVPLWKMPNVEDVLWKVAVEDGVYSIVYDSFKARLSVLCSIFCNLFLFTSIASLALLKEAKSRR